MSMSTPQSDLEAKVTATDENGKRYAQVHVDDGGQGDRELQRRIGKVKEELGQRYSTTRVFVNRPLSTGNNLYWSN